MDLQNTTGQLTGQIGTSIGQSMPEEKNKYELLNFKEELPRTQEITFYKLNPDGTYENGTTLEEMLRVSIERLQDLNSRFACRENSLAITKMQESLFWLNHRTENRIKRDVEGKHLA